MKAYKKKVASASDFMACSFRDEGCCDMTYPEEYRLQQINRQVKRQAYAMRRKEKEGQEEKGQIGR